MFRTKADRSDDMARPDSLYDQLAEKELLRMVREVSEDKMYDTVGERAGELSSYQTLT